MDGGCPQGSSAACTTSTDSVLQATQRSPAASTIQLCCRSQRARPSGASTVQALLLAGGSCGRRVGDRFG